MLLYCPPLQTRNKKRKTQSIASKQERKKPIVLMYVRITKTSHPVNWRRAFLSRSFYFLQSISSMLFKHVRVHVAQPEKSFAFLQGPQMDFKYANETKRTKEYPQDRFGILKKMSKIFLLCTDVAQPETFAFCRVLKLAWNTQNRLKTKGTPSGQFQNLAKDIPVQ